MQILMNTCALILPLRAVKNKKLKEELGTPGSTLHRATVIVRKHPTETSFHLKVQSRMFAVVSVRCVDTGASKGAKGATFVLEWCGCEVSRGGYPFGDPHGWLPPMTLIKIAAS